MITAATIAPGNRIHHWMIIAINGRRVTARCRCNQIRIVTIEDLLSGVRGSCGCAPPKPEHRRSLALDGNSSTVAIVIGDRADEHHLKRLYRLPLAQSPRRPPPGSAHGE
jgi:hypothetical protein